ncbi:GOLPH3/VPS74 family protein [Pelagicoccus mobilis]|uniref:GPP34 family phosphoprotein n=1 Tax=Pelagicoccus mobilis TaxID=415221 RepID=A0A934S3M8_9BACT|nr:GPP34 family phosphoprotein [Pelagicoccus mobilis]MBK1880081.1 GPP34 family phosphoprotein [Pelagicoccus mobilis]
MLHLYQEITLLALRDDKGTVSIEHLDRILAGALVAELILEKRIAVSPDKKRFIDLLDASPSGDALLDECLQKVSTAKRRARLSTWMNRFAGIKRIHHQAAESLVAKGILKKETAKLLLVFNRTVYPEVDSKPEQKIIERLERIIFTSPAEVEARDVVLLSLANSAALLTQIFGRKRLKPQKAHIKRVTEGELVGEVTREIIETINAAIIVAAVIVPVVVSS